MSHIFALTAAAHGHRLLRSDNPTMLSCGCEEWEYIVDDDDPNPSDLIYHAVATAWPEHVIDAVFTASR